ncbi:GDSL esterase/lipase At4g10955-like isoform X2 [Fagus crenata]
MIRNKLDIYNLSGPTHLTAIDWNNADHRRSIVASLVQGVYVLEQDRQHSLRQEAKAFALPWWESFHFQLNYKLLDNVDKSIFGAIYELKPVYNSDDSARSPPKYVVAFRGNVLESYDTCVRDLKLDIEYYFNILHWDSRFELAIKKVEEMVHLAGSSANVWLAGHSLGSAIALIAGKNMTRLGYELETYLFNPPFASLTSFFMRFIKNQTVKDIVHFSQSRFKAIVAKAYNNINNKAKKCHDPFVLLSTWLPYLFVNPDDPLCSGYISYFENKKKMEKIGAKKYEKLATKTSMRSLIFSGLATLEISEHEPEDLHLLPSAHMFTNRGQLPASRRAHGIEQWWNPDTHCHPMVYQFKE